MWSSIIQLCNKFPNKYWRELEKNKDSVGTIVEDTSNLSLGLENFDIELKKFKQV